MTHVKTSNSHPTDAGDGQSSMRLHQRVRVATFVNLSDSKDVEVLKIQDCTTFDDSIRGLSNKTFCEFFRSNVDLVLVVIEVDGSLKKAMKQNFDLEDFEFDRDGRTWIVQITSTTEQSSMIFFKEAEFSYIYIANGKITNQGQRCEENHFDELVKEILPNILRCPQLSLLDLSLTLDQQNYFIEKGNLCQKLINLHNSETEPASKRKKVETETEFTMKQLEEMILLVDGRNYNMLMNAIEEKNERLIETLVKLDFDLTKRGNDGKRAVDLAIDNKMFDVFVKLIEADSPFPEATQIEKVPMQSNAFKKLCDVIKERGEFHELIGAGDIDSLKAKISQNPKLKFAYGLDNKSALTYALEQKKFEIFSFLQFQGFSKGVDPFYDKAFGKLTGNEKDSIAWYNMDHYRSFTSAHVNLLVSKTKIASKVPDESKSYEEVWKFYNDLDSIPQVSEVLQIVALFEDLTINFDFESSNVHKMHPSQSRNTEGVFFEGGFIYIAAGQWQSDRNEVLGVIAHEFTHCAMNKIYKNSCNPYSVDDFDRKREFEQIVDATETVVHFEENPEKWISFVYEKYPRKAWPTELIVRVPHLLAIYKDDDDKIEELKLTFVDLFKFYETKSRPDLQRHLEIARFAEKVKTLNDEAGLITQIKNEEIEFETSQAAACLEEISEIKISLLVSNSLIHSIAAMIKHLHHHEILYIAIDLRFLVKQFSSIQELLKANQQLFLIINCTDQLDECQKEFDETIRSLEKCKIFLIVDDSVQQRLLKLLDGSNLNVCDLNHKWQDLTANYQTRIMQKFVKFHGNPISLGDLLGSADSCPALDVLPLNQIVGQKQLTVSEKAGKPSGYYFPRQFLVKTERHEDSEIDLSSDDVVARVKRESFAIISGIAGSGKSTALKEMAKKLKQNFPDRWVTLVDLKQHFDVFSREPSMSTFEEFAFSLIGSIQSSNGNFERELFKHFYANGKVLLLLDGFDEISPHYKQIVSDFLSKFEPKQGNQLWITTRSHLQSHLEELFDVPSFQLSPINKDEQIEFLLGHWQRDSESSRSDPKLESQARTVVESFNTLLNDYADSIGIPLLLGIAASTYKHKVDSENSPEIANTFNLYSLYEEFFDRKIQIWRHDKGELSVHDQKQIDKSGNAVLVVHQKLAMKLLLPVFPSNCFSVEYDKNVWRAATLARVGFVLCSDDPTEPEFLHRTFAEFLVAQFIVLNLTSENQMQAVKVFVEIHEQGGWKIVSQFLGFALTDHEIKLRIKPADCAYMKEHLGARLGSGALIMKTKNQEQTFRLHIEIAKQILTACEIRSMLIESDVYGDNIIHVVSKYDSKMLMKKVFSVLREYLSDEEIKGLLNCNRFGTNCLHLAAIYNRFDSLKVCHEFVKSFFTVEDLKEMWILRDSDDPNVFLQAVRQGTHESLKNVLEISTEILTVIETKLMLKERDNAGQNILFVVLNNNFSLANYSKELKTFLDDEEIIELMLSADNDGNNVLYCAFKRGGNSPQVLQNYFDDLKGLLSDEQQKELLKMRNKKNENIFAASFASSEIASKSFYGVRNFKECVAVFILNAKKILPVDEGRAMLEECELDEFYNFCKYDN